MIKYFEECYNDIYKHALEWYPWEICGIIIKLKNKYKYIPSDNLSDKPEDSFVLDDELLIKYEGDIAAIVHSHDNYPHASKYDMEQQLNYNIPFGIVNLKNGQVRDIFFWGDTLPVQDYVGRPFFHGVYDCYGLARDYYRHDLNITLPQVPREYGWWKTNTELILDNLQKAGFEIISNDIKDLKKYDGILTKLNSKVINHCGVYVGNNLILHHVCLRRNSLSCYAPLTTYGKRYINYIVRYKG